MSQPSTAVDHDCLMRFFRPEPGEAHRQLVAAAKHCREVSRGEVRRPELISPYGRPERDGLFCAKLFGPLKDDSCLCGCVKSDAGKRGTECPKCGVPIAPAGMRDEQWAHIELAWPLLHPALVPELTAALGWTEAELRAVLGFEGIVREDGSVVIEPYDDPNDCGANALERAAALRGVDKPWLMGILPVPPPGARPLLPVTNPAGGRWAPKIPSVAGVDNRALQALVLRNNRLGRLLELEAPPIIIALEIRAVQRLFERVLRTLGLPLDHPDRSRAHVDLWTGMDEATDDEEERDDWPAPEVGSPPSEGLLKLNGAPGVSSPDDRKIHQEAPLSATRPRGLCFVGEDRVLLQLGYVMLLIELSTGRILWRGPATECELFGSVGDRVLFGERYGRQFWEGALAGAAVLDLDTFSWLDHYPADLPAVYVEKDQPEDAWLCDWHRRRTAAVEEDCSGDRAQELARTPDHRFLWVSSSGDDGAVMSTETAQCHLLISGMNLGDQEARALTPNGPAGDPRAGWDATQAGPSEGWALGNEELDDDGTYLGEGGRVAIARGPDELWTILDCWWGVSVDGEVRFRLPFEPDASAFTPDARRLAAANAGWLVVVELDPPAITHRFDLRPLAPALDAPRPKGVGAALWDVLLATHGVPVDIFAQDKQTLFRIPGVGPRRIGALRRLQAGPFPTKLSEVVRKE